MMVLHHSGSHDDRELVRIETDELSLIIKGKPYHERYESLRSYQQLNFHDFMEFSVIGETVQQVKVYDVDEDELLENSNQRPIFFENGVYQLIIMSKTEETFEFYHEHPSIRDAISEVPMQDKRILMGNLNFQSEIGFTTFKIKQNDQVILSVTLEIFPVKLDYRKDYIKLLEEVNNQVYNLAYHFVRKTYLRARTRMESQPSMAEFYRLITVHFDQLMKSIERIESQPHHELEKTYEPARADQLRRQDSFTRNYLRKNPQVFIHSQKGIRVGNKYKLPTRGLRIRRYKTYNTLENQYIKWILTRLIQQLDHLIEKIIHHQNRWNRTKDETLLYEVRSMKRSLKRKITNSFWREIDPLTQKSSSLVLLMAPGYRDALQIYLILSRGLNLQGQMYRMSVKDVAQLYEYWTFLKFGEILERKYIAVSDNIVEVNRDGLFVNLKANKYAERVFQHPITKEKITLVYQKYYRDLPTTAQIPDSMLKIEKKGKNYTFNYLFDAKYRIDYAVDGSSYQNRYGSPGPMEDDINTMHRYRDAIVSASEGPYERLAFGAYVLFPWFDEVGYENHEFYKSIDQVNVGGLPFLPNATTLVERFIERLIDVSPGEIYEEGILPRGTIDHWKSDLDDNVLVGLVPTLKQYKLMMQKKCYVLKGIKEKDHWHNVKYVALYLKKGIDHYNGISIYGEITNINIKGDSIIFYVKHWKTLSNVIKPVNYGIASHVWTTYQLLQEAKELPELFVKSQEELTLWRLLRRISNNIFIDLDTYILDRASKITKFDIQGLIIYLDQETERITIEKENEINVIKYDELKNNLSQVFNKIVSML